MVSESFFASVCGPSLASRTEVAKDVGIYSYELNPAVSLKATFKKSSTAPNCLAISDTHVFAAQKDKAHVHVYSRIRGNQEALVPFPEKITSIALIQDALLIGTAQGRLTLWEVCLFLRFPSYSSPPILVLTPVLGLHWQTGYHATVPRPSDNVLGRHPLSHPHGLR